MRDEGFAKAKAAVEGERFRRLLLDCALWLLNGGWRNDADALTRGLREGRAQAFAQDELARRIRKISKQAGKLDRLDSRKRHKLRIAVKKVRYGREFFEALYPDGRKPKRKLDRALKKLQSRLGNLNDMRVHIELARNLARGDRAAGKAFALAASSAMKRPPQAKRWRTRLRQGSGCARRDKFKMQRPAGASKGLMPDAK